MNGNTTKVLATIVTVLLTVIGLLAGHIHTYDAMMTEMRKEYVPRSEIKVQLDSINSQLSEVKRILEKIDDERRRDG